MRTRFYVYLPVAMMMLLAWPAQQVFGQLGYINGEVTDAQGNPLEDVQITIQSMESNREYQLETNEKGEYIHAGVPIQSIYRVIARKEGYRGDYVEGIKPGFGRNDERSTINFQLQEGQARKMAFEMTDEEIAELQKRREEQQKRQEQMQQIREDFNQAVTFFNAGQYEQAASAFQTILETDDQQPAVWGNLANTYARMERYEDALNAYDKAIELAPEDSSYYQNKGSVYSRMGETEKAKELFEKSAALNADLNPQEAAVSYYNMGVTYINSGQNEEAAAALKAAIELDPDHAESHYQLGITLLGLNDTDGALEHLKKYVDLGGPNADNMGVAQALIEQLGG